MGDFDLFVAGGMALIAAEDEQNFFKGTDDSVSGNDINDYYPSTSY